MSVLEVVDLGIAIGPRSNPADIVTALTFSIDRGQVLGLVGESGCGKSLTSLAAMGLLPERGPWLRSGSIKLDGTEVAGLPPHKRLAGGHGGIAMIFQEPMTSLNPVLRIGEQVAEAVRVHDRISGSAIDTRVAELLRLVRLPDAEMQMRAFPHELSGGMRQRVMIAIALACRPRVLIADEPTTALDVTVQLQILGLLRELCDTLGMAMLFITHDLGVVAQLVDTVAVMYAGRIVESAPVAKIFGEPAHPYTLALRDCIPEPERHQARLATIAGQAPGIGEIRIGCRFAPRCPRVHDDCRDREPPLPLISKDHVALCRYPVLAGAAR